MPTAGQSTKPSVFLPIFRSKIAECLELDERFVRLVAEPDPKKWSYLTQSHAAAIHLGPISGPLVRNAGAGREGTPIEQTLMVYLRSRSFADSAGGSESVLMAHYDREIQVVDKLHLQHLPGLFIQPPRLIEEGNPVRRTITPDGSIETMLPFLIKYPLALTVA